MNTCGAEVLVGNLKAQGVKHVFGVPRAKIDRVFDALLGSGIETVVCRHEQNASFIAAGLGKLTGKAGVCLVTSGPGCTNLVTGFATANSEGMPIVGLGGAVPRAQRLKQAHQSLDTVTLFKPITKYSAEVDAPEARQWRNARLRSRQEDRTSISGERHPCRRCPGRRDRPCAI